MREKDVDAVLQAALEAGASVVSITPHRASLETVSEARRLAGPLGASVTTVVIGPGSEPLAADLTAQGADRVVVFGPRPGHVAHVEPIALERPRRRSLVTSPAFVVHKAAVLTALGLLAAERV